MATSNSTNFDQPATEIIKDALILISGIEDDETPTDNQLQYAMRHLNRMAKAWSVKGMKVWQWQEATLPLVVGQEEYEIGPTGADLVIPKPLAIANGRRLQNGIETPIDIKSRNEYMNQTNKAGAPSYPSYIYFQPGIENAEIYVWSSPAAADSINFSYKSYIEDFDSLDNTPCFPSEWLEALVYGLAMRLCPMYSVTGQDKDHIVAMATLLLEEAETSDTDQGSVFVQPAAYYYGYPW